MGIAEPRLETEIGAATMAVMVGQMEIKEEIAAHTDPELGAEGMVAVMDLLLQPRMVGVTAHLVEPELRETVAVMVHPVEEVVEDPMEVMVEVDPLQGVEPLNQT